MRRTQITLAISTGVLGCLWAGCHEQPEGNEAAWRVQRLAEGDFHLEEGRSMAMMEPYHVTRLIEIGPRCAPYVARLLGDDRTTDFVYIDKLAFGPSVVGPYGEVRYATLSDIGDYILRRIYGVDVGYRSYGDREARLRAAEQWHRTIEMSVIGQVKSRQQ